MKEVSLKRPVKKTTGVEAMPMRDTYPSFSVHDDAPDELMKCEIGKEMMAKVKLTSKDKHEGPQGRQGVGFDVMSMMVDDTDEKVKSAREKGKAIADNLKKEKMGKKGMSKGMSM